VRVWRPLAKKSTAVHHHAGVSRLLNELVDEWLHAADCRPVQNLSASVIIVSSTYLCVSPVAARQSKSRTSVGQGRIPAACQPITAANLTGRRQSSRVVIVVAKKAHIHRTMTSGSPSDTNLATSTLWISPLLPVIHTVHADLFYLPRGVLPGSRVKMRGHLIAHRTLLMDHIFVWCFNQ